MDTEQPRPRIPKFQFRVLIIGRANAGKTSILQRICETTDSPIVRKRTKSRDQMEVCGQPFVCESDLIADQVTELNPSMDVSNLTLLFGCILTWYQRGEHTIDDELVFSNHQGYIFHDSRGIESGSTEELEILQEFIQRKRGEGRLRDRLHAIWFGCSSVQDADSWWSSLRYCVPMDNQRPQLDLKFYKDICPDRNGVSSWTFTGAFNIGLWSSRHSCVHQIWPVLAQCRNAFGGFPKWLPGLQCVWSSEETIWRALFASTWSWC